MSRWKVAQFIAVTVLVFGVNVAPMTASGELWKKSTTDEIQVY